MTISARKMREGDRAVLLADPTFLQGQEKVLDQRAVSVHVVEEDGEIVGVAVGIRPSDTSMPALWGEIRLRDPARLDHWVKLLLAKVQDAVDDGFTEGFTRTSRRDLLPIGENVFGIRAIEAGWEPVAVGEVRERVAVEWEFHAHLPTFLETLKRLDGAL